MCTTNFSPVLSRRPSREPSTHHISSPAALFTEPHSTSASAVPEGRQTCPMPIKPQRDAPPNAAERMNFAGSRRTSNSSPQFRLQIQRVIEDGENSIITRVLISTCSIEQENNYISFALFFFFVSDKLWIPYLAPRINQSDSRAN